MIHRRSVRSLFGAALLALAGSPAAPAAELPPAAIAEALARDLIPANLTMQQAQTFCENRFRPFQPPNEVVAWEAEAKKIRAEVLDNVVFRGEAAKWRDAPRRVEWTGGDIAMPAGPGPNERGYRIRKVRYEALPGMWIPALLYEPEGLTGRVPVILNVNGHDSAGKAAVYKQTRCINQAKRGMLALNVEWFQMGQLRTDGFAHGRMNQLDLCGSSGIAPFYLAMTRGIDLLLAHEHADPARVAVMGLSGGGWQTIFVSSLDERVTLANPVAGYSSFKTRARFLSDLGDSEQTPCDLAVYADYTHLTALRAPRPTLLTFNSKDQCCFRADHAPEPLLAAAKPVFELYGKGEALRLHVNDDPGDHNFEKDNREAVYKMIGDFFYPGDASYSAAEIPCAGEIKTAAELEVPLPEGNEDFHTLAMKLAEGLPRNGGVPGKSDGWDWIPTNAKDALARAPALYKVLEAKEASVEARDGMRIEHRILGVGTGHLLLTNDWVRGAIDWNNPATVFTPADAAKGAAIILTDGGRNSPEAAAEVARQLKTGRRVVALDVYYFGECKLAERDYLWSLLIAGVGERPLGVQANQVRAVAGWLAGESGGRVEVSSIGPRSSVIALAAAALDAPSPSPAIGAVELAGSMATLKEVLEKNMKVEDAPELFCFGLLEKYDLRGLAGATAPSPVRWRGENVRAKAEWAGLTNVEWTEGP